MLVKNTMQSALLASLLGFVLFVAPVWLRAIPLDPTRPIVFGLVAAAYNHISTDTVLLLLGGGAVLGCMFARWPAVLLGWVFVMWPVLIILVEGIMVRGTHSLIPIELFVYFLLGAVGALGVMIGVSLRIFVRNGGSVDSPRGL